MKHIIRWNEKNKLILTEMYNAEKSDNEISEYFGAATFAIAKQRSNMGLVRYKKLGMHRCAKVKKEDKEFYAIYYMKDNRNHFSVIDVDKAGKKDVNDIVRKMIYNQNIDNVMILKPIAKLTRGSMEEKSYER